MAWYAFKHKVVDVIEDKEFETWISQRKGIFTFPLYEDWSPMKEDISVLQLSSRSFYCLKKVGFTDVASLVREIKNNKDWMKIRNCDYTCQRDILISIFLYQYSRMTPQERKEYQDEVMKMNW